MAPPESITLKPLPKHATDQLVSKSDASHRSAPESADRSHRPRENSGRNEHSSATASRVRLQGTLGGSESGVGAAGSQPASPALQTKKRKEKGSAPRTLSLIYALVRSFNPDQSRCVR
jgi:hypothetical protein